MIALIQRVSQASVQVAGDVIGAIGSGLLALVCAERGDSEREADALLATLLGYRVVADDAGKMNRSLRDVGGGLLIVPQFTLAAGIAVAAHDATAQASGCSPVPSDTA